MSKSKNTEQINNTYLYNVNIYVRKDHIGYRIVERLVKETSKSYVSVGSRIDKNKLGVIDSSFRNDHNMIGFNIYCLKEDISTIKFKLYEAMLTRLEEIVIGVNNLQQQILTQSNPDLLPVSLRNYDED